jgi:predicted nuclease with TOPRIM domain
VTRDVTECEKCPIKDSRIKELEDVVRKTTQLTSANQIAEVKLKQIKKELSDKTSQIAKLSDELKHIKEKQAEVPKDDNLNLSNVAVTNTRDFEFSLILEEVRGYLALLHPKIGDGGKVWFSGKLDKDTGQILSIKFGRIAGHSDG